MNLTCETKKFIINYQGIIKIQLLHQCHFNIYLATRMTLFCRVYIILRLWSWILCTLFNLRREFLEAGRLKSRHTINLHAE